MSSLPSPITNGAPITDLPFTPNFGFTYSVLLNVPIAQVYPVLGTDEGHERAGRLNPLCTLFEMLQRDTVVLAPDVEFWRASVREKETASEGGVLVNRRFFVFEETVPILLGITSKVRLNGTFAWLDSTTPTTSPAGPFYSIYETVADGGTGIKVWKVRKLEEEMEGEQKKTRVTEELKGWAPLGLAWVSEKKGEKAHREQMETFHTLFE